MPPLKEKPETLKSILLSNGLLLFGPQYHQKQPYIVCEMTSVDFINFKEMSSKVRNLNVDDSGNKISWSKVRQVVSKADDPSRHLIMVNPRALI